MLKPSSAITGGVATWTLPMSFSSFLGLLWFLLWTFVSVRKKELLWKVQEGLLSQDLWHTHNIRGIHEVNNINQNLSKP